MYDSKQTSRITKSGPDPFSLSRYVEKAFSAARKFYVSEAFFSGTVQAGAKG
jgi:hypothetical protein